MKKGQDGDTDNGYRDGEILRTRRSGRGNSGGISISSKGRQELWC